MNTPAFLTVLLAGVVSAQSGYGSFSFGSGSGFGSGSFSFGSGSEFGSGSFSFGSGSGSGSGSDVNVCLRLRSACNNQLNSATQGVSQVCYNALSMVSATGHFSAANCLSAAAATVTVACQQSIDAALTAADCPNSVDAGCYARGNCANNNFNTVGVTQNCYEAVGEAGISIGPACNYPFSYANVSVACQQAADAAINATGCPRVTACDARTICANDDFSTVGVTQGCYDTVGQAGIPNGLTACNYNFAPANVSVACQQAVDAAITAGCPTPASNPVLELTFPGDLSSYNEAAKTEIKNSITAQVEAQTGVGTVARVDLLSGSIRARVVFRPSAPVTTEEIDTLATTYTTTPMTVTTASGTSLTSSGAAASDEQDGDDSDTSGAAGQTELRGLVAIFVALATVLTMA